MIIELTEYERQLLIARLKIELSFGIEVYKQKDLDTMKSILSKLEYQASSMLQEDILTLNVTIGNFYDDNYSKQVEVKVSKEFYDKLVNFADIVEYGKAQEALVHIIQNEAKDLPEDWNIETISLTISL